VFKTDAATFDITTLARATLLGLIPTLNITMLFISIDYIAVVMQGDQIGWNFKIRVKFKGLGNFCGRGIKSRKIFDIWATFS
jgi:hypothetical protein